MADAKKLKEESTTEEQEPVMETKPAVTFPSTAKPVPFSRTAKEEKKNSNTDPAFLVRR